ncbi:MAG: hypothetical protein JWM75_2688, partial [Sphingomonas bacterium]|nr:hypothetical protein [Sphingomonas bacterium]
KVVTASLTTRIEQVVGRRNNPMLKYILAIIWGDISPF